MKKLTWEDYRKKEKRVFQSCIRNTLYQVKKVYIIRLSAVVLQVRYRHDTRCS